MKRREFLQTVGSAGVATIPLLPFLTGCGTTGLATYMLRMRNRQVVLNPSEYPEFAEIGGAVEIDVEGYADPIVVVRKSETGYLAVSPICTHLGCTVRKEPTVFRCPCHGSTYELDGSVVRGPAERPLSVYATQADSGKLFINL